MMLLCVRYVHILVLRPKYVSSPLGMNSCTKVAHMSLFHFVVLFSIPRLNSEPRCIFDVRNTKFNANFNIVAVRFLWVFPRRLSSKSRRFETLYRFHLQGQVDEEPIEGSETSEFRTQTLGNYPPKKLHKEHGESLKSLTSLFIGRVFQQWNFIKKYQGVNFSYETVNNTAVFTVMFNWVFVITLQNADTSD